MRILQKISKLLVFPSKILRKSTLCFAALRLK
jgi:hypothetical protein